MLGGVGQGFPNLIGLVLLVQSAGGAGHDALTAADAADLYQIPVELTADVGVEAAVVGADDGHALVAAGSHAAAAQHALGVVPDQMSRGSLNLGVGSALLEGNLFHAKLLGQDLELAGAVPMAGQAFHAMVGKDQLQGHLPGLLHLGAVGPDHHALVDGIDAGGAQGAGALHFHQAQTAGADLVETFQVAQGGDIHTGDMRGFHDGGTGGYGNFLPVDFHVDSIH